jgi:hypothetical protein
VARLNRDHPDLAEQVNSGERSANAAAIEAGFRKRMFAVPSDNIEQAVDKLIKRFGLEAVRNAVNQRLN